MPYSALLDDAVNGRAVCYEGYAHSRFLTAAELDTLDACLHEGWQRGLHVFICADYEFGLPLANLPGRADARLALHWFARRRETDAASWLAAHCPQSAPAGISAPQSDTPQTAYIQAVHDIQAAIARGDTYQINYTTRLHLTAYGHPAENVMIVDLLRNDLGKIARTGRVCVPEPFKVSRFGSVWQMTSLIEAEAKPQTRAADIFRAAFPCGSITGAPKRMSMQIIGRTETAPRGLYTGSIGFLEPCEGGLGFHGTLNVVIRTLELSPLSDGLYRGVYGVGSGIVADSGAQAEYTECQWKARFLTRLQPEFGIFETLRAQHKQCALLHLHAGRLKQSAAALNLPCPDNPEAHIRAYLNTLPDNGIFRVKAELTASSGLSFSHAPLGGGLPLPKVCLAETVLPVHDYLRRFKTTRREIYDTGWREAERQGAFDSLFFNRDGFLLEGGRSNVFVKTGNEWHTPALDLDILNGVMRQAVLADPERYLGTATVHESRITRAMLRDAGEIRLSNALRGVFSVDIMA